MSKYQTKQVKKYGCTVIAVLFTLVYLFPLYWMVITSFKTKEEIFSAVPTFWPSHFSFDASVNFPIHMALCTCTETVPKSHTQE